MALISTSWNVRKSISSIGAAHRIVGSDAVTWISSADVARYFSATVSMAAITPKSSPTVAGLDSP